MEEIDISDWPMCSIEGCPNRCCLALNSNRCYPHTVLGPDADPYLLAGKEDESVERLDRSTLLGDFHRSDFVD